MIFVQIAAYRDPELLPTIQDCLEKAKYPRDLIFGICWQTDRSDTSLDQFQDRKNFRIDRVDWAESKGLCWARSRIQNLHEGEQYTLQIDSHHRFAENWDEFLINSMESCGSPKPIITTYAGIYDPETNRKKGIQPFKMVADRFTRTGTILFRPHRIPDWKDLKGPIPSRFVSGHYFFTIGDHCQDYHYDPNLYFAGDEISLSIRSFTLGYDLFHPHKTVIWHEYTRKGRVKHWDDHVAVNNENGVEKIWTDRDAVSKRRLRKLLREEENDEILGKYGLGKERSHRDYEIYAGIDFLNRRLHHEAVSGANPPCTYINSEQWENAFTHHQALTLRWNRKDVQQCEDLQFLYFGVEDNCGNVLYRYDAPPDSPEAQLLIKEKRVEFQASSKPSQLIVWPYSMAKGWMNKIEYKI